MKVQKFLQLDEPMKPPALPAPEKPQLLPPPKKSPKNIKPLGVFYDKGIKRYSYMFSKDGVKHSSIGSFASEQEAQRALADFVKVYPEITKKLKGI
jgi:hypothetical protein